MHNLNNKDNFNFDKLNMQSFVYMHANKNRYGVYFYKAILSN